MNSSNFHTLKEVLNQLIELNDWGEKLAFAKIKDNWINLVGNNFAEHIQPKKLKDGILSLKADSSPWRTEMLLRKEQIINQINTFLGQNVIKSIVIR